MDIQSMVSQLEYERERFTSEHRFADWLLSRDRKLAARWEGVLAEMTARVNASLETRDVNAVRTAVRAAEAELSGLGDVAKSYTVYCAGHAHMDMNWMWGWPETVAATIDSITTVLRLLDEFPSFVFSQSQASIYRILEEYRPDLLEEAKRHVASGRWEVTASHWVETDKNLVTGESLARHLLYARAYMERLFGLSPEDVAVDWAPDTFGHAHTVPDYLVRGGVRFVYLHRPGSDGGPPKPGLFRWKGAGGSQVIVHNDMYYGYNGVVGPHIGTEVLTARVEETGVPFALFVYGVGDHGGGPTRADVSRAIDMDRWPLFPTIAFSTAKAYFERVEREAKSLPVLDQELNYEFTGCYTTQTLIKRANRLGEQRLLSAELASSLASRLGSMPYPRAVFEERWRDHLFSHFHDILPGSGVHDTRTYTHGLYQKIVAAAGAAETQALRLIAELVDTKDADDSPAAAEDRTEARIMGAGAGHGSHDGGLSHYTYARSDRSQAVVVFNHLETARREIVEAVLWDQGGSWGRGKDPGRFTVTGPDGAAVEAQLLEGGAYWGHEYRRVAFPAVVAGLGYARYIVRHDDDAGRSTNPARVHVRDQSASAASMHLGISNVCSYAAHERGPEGLENEFLRLELDPATGGIRRLVRRQGNQVLIDQPTALPLLSFAVERPGAMSAWQINHVMPAEQPVLVSLTREIDGPVAASFAATYRVRSSEVTLTYRVHASDPIVHLSVQGTWLERGGPQIGTPVLSLRLPTTMSDGAASYEIPFGSIDRVTEHGEEVPALAWAAVSTRSGGLALFNDSKHGHSFAEGELALTLIRSSYEPDPLPEIGEHAIRCGLLCLDGRPDPTDLSRRATAFCRPLAVVNTDAHEGSLPPAGAFVTVESDRAVVSGIKNAEATDALVVRLYNPSGSSSTATVSLDPSVGIVSAATLVDLMERPLDGGEIQARSGRVSVPVDARAIVTVMLEVKE
jgi:alpha-mannosidase